MNASVVAVSADSQHRFSKPNAPSIRVVEGLGIEGDAHRGVTVQHRSRVRKDPTQPNLRQVHLMHVELHDELRELGYDIKPGDLGENVTTRGVDLLGLTVGALLRVGADVVLEVTGLRNPCQQINNFRPGLLKHVVFKDSSGALVRKAGIMTVVRSGGLVKADDPIMVELPDAPHQPLEPV